MRSKNSTKEALIAQISKNETVFAIAKFIFVRMMPVINFTRNWRYKYFSLGSWARWGSNLINAASVLLHYNAFAAWRAGRRTWRKDARAATDPPLVVMLVISNLRRDPRVEREARALARAGYSIKIIWPKALDPTPSLPPPDWGQGITFETVGWYTNQTSFFPWLFGFGLWRAAIRYRPFAFHAHDLSAVMPAFDAAARAGSHLVCDFHEWFSENVKFGHQQQWVPVGRFQKVVYKATENAAIRVSSQTITVCESIARELEKQAGAKIGKIQLLRNIPSANDKESNIHPFRPLKDELGLPEGSTLILYQGGLGATRLLEPVIEALKHTDERIILAIRGPGIEFEADKYKSVAAAHGVSNRLHLLLPVDSNMVVEAARSADAGLWTLPNFGKNFYYALPNKIFEYIFAEIPLLCADYPEVRKIVAGHEVGALFDPYDTRSIAAAMTSIGLQGEKFRKYKSNVENLSREYRCLAEMEKIVEIYNSLER